MENNRPVEEGTKKIRVYGSSVSSIKKDLENITSTSIGRKNIYTKETGRITITPELFTTAECCDPGAGCTGGDGEGALICLLVIATVMALVAIVWTVIMIAFSILTIGGFLKRRYRTLIVIDKPNRELLGKLVVSITRRGGVVEYPWGIEEYDQWMRRTFRLHVRLKTLRQVSLFLAFIWGFIEIWYKLNNILYGTDYNLWPFRIVMVIIFLPLLFSGPVLEFQFNNADDASKDVIYRLLTENPSFNPEYPMTFEEEPQLIGGMSSAAIRKLKEPPKDE